MKQERKKVSLMEEEYFFLKEKVLELQRRNRNACLSAEHRQAPVVSIIQDLVEMQQRKSSKAQKL